MKKLSLILSGLVFGVSLNAAVLPVFNFHKTYDKSTIIGVQYKNVDIKNIGIKSGGVYGLIVNFKKDFGEKGYWGFKFTNEFDYGKLDLENSNDKITYADYLLGIGPSYTIEKLHLEVFVTGKLGYVDLENTEGYFYGFNVGAEYRPFKWLTLGVGVDSGKFIPQNAVKYDMNSYRGYIGFNFWFPSLFVKIIKRVRCLLRN